MGNYVETTTVNDTAPVAAEQGNAPDHATGTANPDTAPAVPENGATVTADAADGAGGTSTANPERPASDAPTGATGEADPGDAAPPVAEKPVKKAGESKAAFKKRLAAFEAAQAANNADAVDHAAAMQRANANAGKGETGNKPADTKPADTKPVDTRVCGYTLTHWPAWCSLIPSRAAILAAQCFGVHEPISKNTLSIACTLEQGNPWYDADRDTYTVYDIGHALNAVPEINRGGYARPDHKMNASQNARDGQWLMLTVTSTRDKLPGNGRTRPRAVYKGELTGKGLAKVQEAFKAAGMAVPLWLSNPQLARDCLNAGRAAGTADAELRAAYDMLVHESDGHKFIKAARAQARSNVPV